jgi:hypothetical protein
MEVAHRESAPAAEAGEVGGTHAPVFPLLPSIYAE